jgi:hypothetical protein
MTPGLLGGGHNFAHIGTTQLFGLPIYHPGFGSLTLEHFFGGEHKTYPPCDSPFSRVPQPASATHMMRHSSSLMELGKRKQTFRSFISLIALL